jgi:type IV secretory pathway VirB9-like protein
MRLRLAVLALLFTSASAAVAAEARIVKYGPKDIVPIRCKIRFTTLIVLPEGETILDYVIGDRDWWVLEGTGNFAYLKPSAVNAETSVTLITQAGNIYSFLAEEIGPEGKGPDLKVFIEPSDASAIKPPQQQKYISGAEHEAVLRALEAEKARASEVLSEYAATYPMSLVFEYNFTANKKPFNVSQIWHDGKFTYVRSTASEKPTLFELKDGKPTLLDYQLRDDVYIAPKVIDSGELVIGKKRLSFTRKSS